MPKQRVPKILTNLVTFSSLDRYRIVSVIESRENPGEEVHEELYPEVDPAHVRAMIAALIAALIAAVGH